MDVADEIPPPGVDTSRPHSARTYDYMLGGKNHFTADREAIDRNLARSAPSRSAVTPVPELALRVLTGLHRAHAKEMSRRRG
jgi:hypothetical protein